MKKYLISICAVLTFIASTMFCITAYAAESIDTATVLLDKTSYTYTGSAVKPSVTVKTAEGTEIDKSNYEVSYENNVNAGTATVTVKGINNYEGSVSAAFTIKPRSITDTKVAFFKLHVNKTPSLNVTYKNKTIKSGRDYTISVANNTKAGKTVTVTVKGKGNFTGTKTLKKIAYPNKVVGISGTDRKTTSLKLKFKSQSKDSVTGYKIYKCDSDGKNLKYYKTFKSASGVVSSYKAGDYVYLKVRSYVTVGKKTYYGDYSNLYKTCTIPAKIRITSISKSSDKKTLKLKWDKVGCTGYYIEYSTDKKFKSGVKKVTVISARNHSKNIKIPKNDKTYYVRIRAFREFKTYGKLRNFKGAWSSKLSTNYNKLYTSYTTNYVNNANRTTNLKLASKAIDGTIIAPGGVFSFNKVVGERTRAKGYKPATIFTGSNSTAQGVGGGICQVASTMFNAALKANFGIVERYQHSQRVSYCPLGRDAAIYWGSEDFKFRNTSNYPIKIKMKCANGKITCSFYACYDVSPKKVSLKVSRSGKTFTLRRYVGGKCNYTTRSTY